MQVMKLRKIGNSLGITLPAAVIAALHLAENDDIAVETEGDRIILMRATQDVQDAWEAYQTIEPRYREANRKLAQ